MNLNILIFNLVILIRLFHIKSEVVTSDITYVDEIILLKKMFNNLEQLKKSVDRINSRYEENLERKLMHEKDTPIFDIRYDELPSKCQNQTKPKNCAEATSCTHRSGIYKILVANYNSEPFLVECDAKTEGGDWILIQRRQDGSVDFYRNWDDYEKGFGTIDGEFFIGLAKLHALTNYNGPQELLIILQDKNEKGYAKYNHFVIGDKNDFYTLKHLGVYKGNAGDSLSLHLGNKFSTKDQDHDKAETANCAEHFTGAWWYKNCHDSNLNGKYGDNTKGKGINWQTFRPTNESIQHVKMMIRRRRF